MRADRLREKFLGFFKARKHKIVESDSLVPKDDPTVLFTPAGMNQFKKEFLGFNSGFKRAATAQRCLRTDDLDKVGKTPAHHTFFEMLGNFSFGDYFKEEAISWAWEFLTEELKLRKEDLRVSVYEDDNEAYKIWRDKIKVLPQKIIKLGDKENFWPSEARVRGPNGPCGPCSEIFFDRGPDTGCQQAGCSPACDCGRFVEVWNLVFTQFNRKEGGVLEPLPQKNIDTGMGLERLAAVMQGVYSNFETDLFAPILKEIKQGLSPKGTVPERGLIYAIADHLRAIAFSIYDGILPSNDGRGYVVRKLIRKGTLHLRALGQKQPFLYKLVPVLSQVMKAPYPELEARKENIAEIILREEKAFIATLNSSETLFKEKFSGLVNKPDPDLAGKITFQLYDTYGIPFELTKEWLDKQGIRISEEAFQDELTQQKNRSKLQSSMTGDVFQIKELALGGKETKFYGYADDAVRAKVLRIIKGSAVVKKAAAGETVSIVLDKTVFYPEGGGQVGDSGEIAKGKNIFEVMDTQKIGKTIVHLGRVKEGVFKNNDIVSAKINVRRRLSIARNHTATHILQAVLREVLGKHVKQQGSLVAEDRLRFDFTHFQDVKESELERIERVVNDRILNNYTLSAKEMGLSAAKKAGALAFFGEKYAERVRVVSVGDFSQELCAGTHLANSGQIGIFKITQEGSVASGIRRIEAVTGDAAYKLIKEEENTLRQVAEELNVAPERLRQELEKKLSRLKELEKQLHEQRLALAADSVEAMIARAESANNVRVIAEVIESADMNLLRKTADLIKAKAKDAVIALGANEQGRALLVLGFTPDLAGRSSLDAAKLIVEVAKLIGGSGGGRKDFAQAGGTKPENFNLAFQELKKRVADLT